MRGVKWWQMKNKQKLFAVWTFQRRFRLVCFLPHVCLESELPQVLWLPRPLDLRPFLPLKGFQIQHALKSWEHGSKSIKLLRKGFEMWHCLPTARIKVHLWIFRYEFFSYSASAFSPAYIYSIYTHTYTHTSHSTHPFLLLCTGLGYAIQ